MSTPVYCGNNPQFDKGHLDGRRKFLLALGKKLIKSNAQLRYENKFVQTYIKKQIGSVFSEFCEQQPEAAFGRICKLFYML